MRDILWQPLLKAFGKGQFALVLFCTLASYWDKKKKRKKIWVSELPFGVNHPSVLFPFRLRDRFPRLFLFGGHSLTLEETFAEFSSKQSQMWVDSSAQKLLLVRLITGPEGLHSYVKRAALVFCLTWRRKWGIWYR